MVVHANQTATVLPTPTPRGELPITAQLIEDRFLHPAMDGRVLNLQQYNPSPEIDSDLEEALEANRRGDQAATEKWILAAMAANDLEGQRLCAIAGTADDAAVSMRTVRGQITGLSGRQVVAKLTGPLGALIAGPDADAARTVVEVVRSTPRSVLVSKQARHQLGKRKMAVLMTFLGETGK